MAGGGRTIELQLELLDQWASREVDGMGNPNALVGVRVVDLRTISVTARRAAALVQGLKRSLRDKDEQMGQAAKAIAQLQSQLAAAQEDAYDPADLAAINSVLTPTPAQTPPPPATVAGGDGADTPAAGDGTDTVAAGAAATS